MRNIIVPALAALSLSAFSTPAAAETQSVSVQYADLDLSSPVGMATLEGRIQDAAKKICGTAEVRDIHDGLDWQRCVRATQASASIAIARVTGTRPVFALNSERNARR